MSVEASRKRALETLRDELSEGRDISTALAAAAEDSGLSVEVLKKIGAPLIACQSELKATNERVLKRVERKRRADKIIGLFRDRLSIDPGADWHAADVEVGIEDFTDEERDQLFDRKTNAWFDRNI